MLHKSISIIIPTKNSFRTINKCIDSIYSQKIANYTFEVIVVDNFSNDGTAEYLKSISKNPNFRYFSLGPERSEQRNFGISKSNYDIIGYIDSDMYLTSHLLKNVLDVFNFRNVDAVKVPEIIYGDSLLNKSRRFERFLYSNSMIDSARFIKKSVFNSVNGFQEGIPGSEDWELDAKLIQAGAKHYFLEKILEMPNPYCKSCPTYLKLEGFIHDEGDISLKKLLSKKNYYKTSNDYIFEYFTQIKSPMINAFSISYRLGLIFDWDKFKRYMPQYLYLPIVLFYRTLHLLSVSIFKY
ncbi:glycosyltransferase [Polynucleobacter paneuropaeus]|nr:glycosyltransferase [Polynucleobacter paneuropaeus]QWD09518.1 glycosyltransferase [Polynucleobacter paneuropaeus]